MKLFTIKFKLGGLPEKQVLVTWKFGDHFSNLLRHREAKHRTVCMLFDFLV